MYKIKNLKVISQGEIEDFTFLKYSKKLIMSHSTFSWWASFLGDQEKVYVPMYKHKGWWKTNPGLDDVDLIYDSDKYIKQILE